MVQNYWHCREGELREFSGFFVKFPQIKVYTAVVNTFRNMCTSLSILNDFYLTGKRDVEKLIFAFFYEREGARMLNFTLFFSNTCTYFNKKQQERLSKCT